MISLVVTSSGDTSDVVLNKNKNINVVNLFIQKALALPPPNMTDSTGALVILSQHWFGIKEIEFETDELAGDGEVDGDEIEFHGPYVVNMFEANPTAIENANIQDKYIRRIKMKTSKVENLPSGAPSALQSNSIIISGTVSGNSFTFVTQEEYEYEVSGPNAIRPLSGDQFLLSIKISNVIKKINLSNINSTTTINESNRVSASNPCPTIDSSASDLYTCFKNGLKSEANFGKDNGDFEFDESDETVKQY